MCTHDISTAGTFSIPSSAAVAIAAWHAGDAVVVGQRHHRDPRVGRRADDFGGLELAVGDGGMGLQVDHRAGANRRT